MTNPGQHIGGGGDKLNIPTMPLPPQPPPEDERIDWSVCHCGHNADGSLMGYCAHCSSVRCDAYPDACNPPVESPDLPSPEAREVAAEAMFVHQPHMGHRDMQSHCGCGEVFKTAVERQRHAAEAVLAAALPHLRSLQVETQIEFGRALGRREAAEEIAAAIENNHGWQTKEQQEGLDFAAKIARDIGKGDPQ